MFLGWFKKSKNVVIWCSRAPETTLLQAKTDTQHVLVVLMQINAICRNRSLHYVNDDFMAFLSSSTLAHSSHGLRLSSLGLFQLGVRHHAPR